MAPPPLNAVNQHAIQRYSEFQFAIQGVADVIERSEAVLKAMREDAGRQHGFKVPTKKEITALRNKAVADLDTLRRNSKEYEAQLIANGWRV